MSDAAERLRLDYVSPLPPVRSGIADYSLDLLPRLEPLCDLRVIGLAGQEVAAEVVERWRPAPATACGEGGRLPLYQMGNNRHHEAVLQLALERPGVVTLHDIVLHHLLNELTLGSSRGRLDRYARRLAADHGWIGELAGRARGWSELGEASLFTLAANRTLLRRQRGVLVHSRWAADLLRDENPELAVAVAPMGVPLPPRPDAAAAAGLRRRLGIDARVPLLGSFGFQTPIKRTVQLVRALARPPLAAAHLIIAGEVSPVLALEQEARQAGVAERVHVTGFLGRQEFSAAIAASDLCVNLRYPTAGETSASLLRVLALGRPALVSDYAQFRELPEEVAVRVPLGDGEVEALAAAAGVLLGEPERLAAMAAAARQYVRTRHDPATAAAAVIDGCLAFRSSVPPAGTAPPPPPPTSLTWRRLPGSVEVAGAAAPWPEGERRRLRILLRNTGEARWLGSRCDPGGVAVELHWRRDAARPLGERLWKPLYRDLDPGAAVTIEAELRRPLGGRLLVIEPHLLGVSGLGALGGPSWVSEI